MSEAGTECSGATLSKSHGLCEANNLYEATFTHCICYDALLTNWLVNQKSHLSGKHWQENALKAKGLFYCRKQRTLIFTQEVKRQSGARKWQFVCLWTDFKNSFFFLKTVDKENRRAHHFLGPACSFARDAKNANFLFVYRFAKFFFSLKAVGKESSRSSFARNISKF